MNEILVACTGLTKRYGHKAALNGVDLKLGRGRIVGLLGPNGSGKTTLIKILCGLLQPTDGAVAIDGQAVGRQVSDDCLGRQDPRISMAFDRPEWRTALQA